MKRSRLIATVLAVVMIFGLVSVGFAASADFPDLEGYEWEKEVRDLASLGIFDGYPDGDFKADNPVTRAEFAKMIVCMLNLEGAAKLVEGETVPFSDVEPTHWASGFINIAEMKGIVSGYPDGTFKPEGNITHAEALKMILTAMGYLEEGFAVVRWPATWIVKATEIDLDEDVEVLANVDITRGQVAKLLDNSLIEPHVKVTEHGFEDLKNKDGKPVHFMGKLGVFSAEGIVTDSPELWDNKSGKVHVDGKKFSIEDYEGLLGHQVTVWYKSLSNVLVVEDLSTEKPLLSADYEDIKDSVRKDMLFFVNYTVGDFVYQDDDVKKADEIVVVYEGSTPKAVKALKYDIATVTDTYEYGSARRDIYVKGAGDVSKLTLAKFDVEYKGAAEEFADIEEDDVIHYIISKVPEVKRAVILVVRDVYEGTLTEITYAGKLKVDGEIFEASDAIVEKARGCLGGPVKLWLDKDGKVFKFNGDEPEVTTTFYGVVQETMEKWDAKDKVQKDFAKVLTVDGEVEYEYKDYEGDIVGKVVYGDVGEALDFSGENKNAGVVEALDSFVVHKVVAKDKKVYRNDGTFEKYTDTTLWIEGKKAPYETRPRPYREDEVTLYLDADGKIAVGIVK